MSTSEQQLLADMRDLFQDFKCTLQDLRNPTEEFVTNFYSYWLQEFEVDINNVTQTQFSQTAVVSSYLDSYSGLIPKINLLKSIRAFEVVPDFGILDIISPTPKRTQSILKAFIHFYDWADSRICSIREKKKELNERKNKILEMTKEREQLRETLNNKTKTIAQIQQAKAQTEEEVVVLQQKTVELRQKKQLSKMKTEETNQIFKEKEMAIQKINKEDSVITNKIKEYSNLIVNSPSTILADIDSLRMRHEEVSKLRDQKRDMVELKQQDYMKLQKVAEGQELRSLQMDEFLKLIDQHKELMQHVSVTEKNTSALQEKLNELASLLIAQSSKKQNRQDSLQSLHLKWTSLKPQLTKSVEAAIRDLGDKKNAKSKMLNSLKEDSAVQEKMDTLLQKIKKFIANFLVEKDQLQIQVDAFCKKVELDARNLKEETQ